MIILGIFLLSKYKDLKEKLKRITNENYVASSTETPCSWNEKKC